MLTALALALNAAGRETAIALMPPTGPVVAGRIAQVDIVALNPGTRAAPFDLENEFSGVLEIGTARWPLTLRSSGLAPVAVASGGFAVRHFSFAVPAESKGSAVLEVKRGDGTVLRTLLEVSADSLVASSDLAARTPLDQLSVNQSASSAIARNFAGRFQPNQPVYFVYGGGEQAMKFQLSFDYRLATKAFGRDEQETVATLLLGYTQRSLWDIDGKSSPFYDTSYMPELVISTEAPMPRNPDQRFTWLGLRSGFQHESNGKDGLDSRSLNIFYVRPRFVIGTLKSWSLFVLPEAHVYIGDLSDNRLIKDYRGYGKLRFYFGRNDGPSLMVSTWAGKSFDHGSFQLDLAVPLHLRWLNVESFFYAQYFDGYGESLLAYTRKSDAFRMGFALVR
jgi:outer membrane phospholipase A